MYCVFGTDGEKRSGGRNNDLADLVVDSDIKNLILVSKPPFVVLDQLTLYSRPVSDSANCSLERPSPEEVL